MTWREPTEIIPMGGGYDWRCYVGREFGPLFLCKDGVPIEGWRVCTADESDAGEIHAFAAWVKSLAESPRGGA